jgi:hypothetical protein
MPFCKYALIIRNTLTSSVVKMCPHGSGGFGFVLFDTIQCDASVDDVKVSWLSGMTFADFSINLLCRWVASLSENFGSSVFVIDVSKNYMQSRENATIATDRTYSKKRCAIFSVFINNVHFPDQICVV